MTAASQDDLPDVFTSELVKHLEGPRTGPTEADCDSTGELLADALRERLERAKWCLAMLHEAAREQRGSSLTGRPERSPGPHHERPKTIGRFQVSKVLGIGGFGIVYLAYDPRTRRDVAVKVPRLEVLASASMLRRFEQEAAAAGKLEHPNIVAVLEAGSDGAVPYMVMPHHPGPTLAEWTAKRRGPPSRAWSAAIVKQLADALEYAHNHGVLHRDVKPSNILLTSIDEGASPDDEPAAVPRLMDFGLAKVADSVGEQTRSGTILGTVRYMSPEQAAGGRGGATRASDVYSLGAVLYQLLTGRVPFEGPTEVETLRRIASDDPPSIPRGRTVQERDVATICMKCLEKSPSRRYRSAAELSDDLQRALAGEIIHARSASAVERWVKLVRRYPARTALVSFLIVGTTALVGETLYHNAQLRTALEQSRASELNAKRHAYAADMRGLLEALPEMRLGAIRDVLDEYVPAAGEPDVRSFE